MKIRRRAAVLVTWWITSLCMLGAKESKSYDLRDGDIVFSSSAAGQGEAIMAATASPYTHCGIVFQKDGRWMVLEAVQPVCVSTLRDFMARGKSEAFIARRLTVAVMPEAYRKRGSGRRRRSAVITTRALVGTTRNCIVPNSSGSSMSKQA